MYSSLLTSSSRAGNGKEGGNWEGRKQAVMSKEAASSRPPSSILLFFLFISSSTHALPLGRTCVGDRMCDAGLHCETCVATGNFRPRCTRIVPVDPKTKGTGLPFDRYSWLTTHNSFAVMNQKSFTGTPRLTTFNQQDSITQQLDRPALDVLREVETFLSARPEEIVTIFIEDYVRAARGLTKVFDDAGLRKYWFPVSRMPKGGGESWPTVGDMIAKNQRLVVFTSRPAKEASEGIAYVWRYVLENQYGDGGMKAGACPSRAESAPMNATTRSLVLVNHFPDLPSLPLACMHNSDALVRMLRTCHREAGDRWANFVAVDFYKRSDGGGAPHAADVANGHLVCGCNDVRSCRVNGTFGRCAPPEEAAAARQKSTPGPRHVSLAGAHGAWCCWSRWWFPVAALTLMS